MTKFSANFSLSTVSSSDSVDTVIPNIDFPAMSDAELSAFLSSSSLDIPGAFPTAVAGPSTPSSSRRPRSQGVSLAKATEIQQAKQHQAKFQEIDHPKVAKQTFELHHFGWNANTGPLTVYIGNLPLTITRREIKSVFRDCGGIADVQMRLTHGSVVSDPNRQPRAEVCETLFPNRQYASVRFFKHEAVEEALKLNGNTKKISGVRLSVSTTFQDLPEATTLNNYQLDQIPGVSPTKRVLKPLQREATEVDMQNQNLTEDHQEKDWLKLLPPPVNCVIDGQAS